MTDVVTYMGVEEESHALGAQIAISILCTINAVNLGVCVQIPYPLDVHHDQGVTRSFKREVTQGLERDMPVHVLPANRRLLRYKRHHIFPPVPRH